MANPENDVEKFGDMIERLLRENQELKEEIEKLKAECGIFTEKYGGTMVFPSAYYNKKMKCKKLKEQIYVRDCETGELTDTTILKSYETPKFKKWKKETLQERIVYECNDDDSDLHIGNYIKYLEGELVS